MAGNGARPVIDELIVGLVTAGPRLFVVGTTGDDDTVVGLQFFDEASRIAHAYDDAYGCHVETVEQLCQSRVVEPPAAPHPGIRLLIVVAAAMIHQKNEKVVVGGELCCQFI